MWCFDCEVFHSDWMFVFIDTEDLTKRKIIVNDPEELLSFYEENKNEVFAGYNARSYDQFILKAILCGEDPKKVNDYIIVSGMKGGNYSKKFKDIDILIYDCMIDKMKSLKQLEAFMGNDIRETSVSFDIKRKLTEEEIDVTLKYCIHDVEQTIEVYKRQPEEFESQTSLVKAFDLPTNYMNKTKAQLSSIILGAENKGNRHDEFNITFPDTLKVSDKYKYIVDWYELDMNRNYKMSLKTDVMGVPHIFAWGGIHGAISNYSGSGFYIMSDVASLYPSIMLEYNFLSRNVPDADKYRQIRDKRLEMKKAKNPMQLPYKIVLNSTYGAMKDKYNGLFDPLMANNVCVTGQLLLLDLIDKLDSHFGDKCELIQSNTDGILVKLPSKEYYEEYVKVCSEWEKRTRLDLEHDIYVTVHQKDVNNYVIVDEKGKYKSKGAYVKKLNDLDYDLPIVNKAVIKYLTSGDDIEKTVKECNTFKDFQKVIKIGRDYEYGMHGDTKLEERVLRIFASSNDNDGGIFKYRNEKIAKVGNTPEKAFIYNDDVNDKECPTKLNKQWYVDLAKKRLSDFMEITESDKKYDIYELLSMGYSNFTDLLCDVKDKSNCKSKDFENMILMGYFKDFGSIKKQHRLFELHKALIGKKSIDIEKIEKLNINLSIAEKFGNTTSKKINKLDGKGLYDFLNNNEPDDEYDVASLVRLQLKANNRITYVNDAIEKNVSVVTSIDSKGSPTLYCLNNGKSITVRLNSKVFSNEPFVVGDILGGTTFKKDFKAKNEGVLPNGRIKWGKDFSVVEWWLQSYVILEEVL